ncbi:MAG: hypothetical protein OEL83_16220 [Desulforhopalus sp.]|nr:hypothetical protein [Desulforhopalus sp.]
MFLKFFRKKAGDKDSAGAQASRSGHGVDPAMHYCYSCGEEYRLALENCLSCGGVMVSGAARLAQLEEQAQRSRRVMALEPGADLVTIRQGPLPEMKYLQQVLARGGVPGLIGGDAAGCGKGCRGPEMYLQIGSGDVDLALRVLAEDFVKSTALDSHDLSNAAAVYDPTAAETVCPACGSRFSPSIGACPECGLSFE